MLSIEKAMSIYTDDVIAGNLESCVDLMNRLRRKDREEFWQSARLIRALYQQKRDAQFSRIFEMLDQRKQELYGR